MKNIWLLCVLCSLPAVAQVYSNNITTPVGFSYATMSNVTTPSNGTALIEAITSGSGTSQAQLFAEGTYNVGAVVGNCVSIANTGTSYDGGTGGSCGTGFQVTAVTVGNPYYVTFDTSITASYTQLNYSFPAMVVAANGNLLDFYQLGTSAGQVPNLGLTERISTNSGSTWGSPSTVYVDPNWAVTNINAGINPATGTIIVFFILVNWNSGNSSCQPGASGCFWQGVYYVRSTNNGSTWSSPTQVTATGTAGYEFALTPYDQPFLVYPNGSLGIQLQDYAQPGEADFVISCDDGQHWGTGTSCPAGWSAVQLIDTAMSSAENAFLYIGNNEIIGFDRYYSGPSGIYPFYFYTSSNLGSTWSKTTSSFSNLPFGGGSQSYAYGISPIMWMVPGTNNLTTLVFGQRESVNTGGENAWLVSIIFNPQSVFSTGSFGAVQTLWSPANSADQSKFGYPTAISLTSPNYATQTPGTYLMQWHSNQMPCPYCVQDLWTTTFSYSWPGTSGRRPRTH